MGLFRKKGWLAFATVLCISTLKTQAQLCTGSLGDPIVNIDFGSGSGRGIALGNAVTAYTYKSTGQLGEGEYTIANSTQGLKGNAWHITGDHTGNTNGYMMVVNCATLASEGVFYTKQVSGLCPNTTYEFSAWIMNVMNFNSPNPNVTFRVTSTTGQVLGSYTTGSLLYTASPAWLQYGFYFNTGTATSVIIKILNSAPSAVPGNDLAIDDITFRACGPQVVASVNGFGAAAVCANESNLIQLQGNVSGGYTSPSYQWQINIGDGWVDIPGAMAIDYTYSMALDALPANAQFRLAVAEGENISSPTCRVLSNSVSLQIKNSPVASYTVNSVACANQGTQFVDQSVSLSNLSYYWYFGDGSTSMESNPLHIYKETGPYQTSLVVISENGCVDTANSPLAITVFNIPSATFSATPLDTTIFSPQVTITDLTTDVAWCSIDWGDGTVTDCSDATHTYAKYGKYTIMQVVANANGCTDTAFVTIIKRPEYRIFIPNAFTPDGDGVNEIFKPGGLGWEEYSLLIYNRWGQKVFETNDTDKGWDGRMDGHRAQSGLYVYFILYRDAVDKRWHEFRGSVTLLK